MNVRVALVATSTADISGSLLAVQLAHLRQAGWDARAFCKGRRWMAETALLGPNLRGHVELAPRARRRASPFDRRVTRLAPDLVHFHSGWAAGKALPRGYPARARIAISLRDDGQDLNLPDARAVQDRADLLLFGHQAALERAAARGWPRQRSVVVNRPVVGIGGSRVPRRSGPLRILSAGQVIWEQGLEHSVHAVRLLLDSGVDCTYRIVGEGDHVQAVAFARHQLGLTDRVELVSPHQAEHLAVELAAADVFVDPAVTDTTSPAEIQAARVWGIPVIATGGRELSCAEGWIEVPRRDPLAIAQALRRVAAGADLPPRPSAERRARALLDAHLAQLEGLYRDVLGLGAC